MRSPSTTVGLISVRALVCAVLLSIAGASLAQDVDSNDPQPLSESVAKSLDTLVSEIEADKHTIMQLQARVERLDGLFQEITQARIDRTWASLFRSLLRLANDVAKQASAGRDVSAYRDQLVKDLAELPDVAFIALERLTRAVAYGDHEMEIVERVQSDQDLLKAIADADDIYSVLVQFVEIAPSFGIDVSTTSSLVQERLAESAENRSIFLDMSTDTIDSLRRSVAVLPTNEDLKGQLSAAEERVRLIASSMQTNVDLMAKLDMDVRAYRKQILTTTGAITTDVLDVGIAANLAAEWGTALSKVVAQKGPLLIFRLLFVAVLLYVFSKIAKLSRNLMGRALDSAGVRISHLLRRMVVATTGNLVFFLGILIALSQLGISLGPLLAGLGIAGFIIGFAMQDSLANFASGMLILFYRPFDIGDVVEAGGVLGKVSSMSLVNTTIMTLDNQTLMVPNNLIWGTVIKNVTAQRTRRVDLVFGISYSDDIEKAEQVFRDIIDNHDKTLDDPEPMVRVHELGESSVNFIVRPWVKTQDYWDVYWDLTREVKLRLDKEGISIPFPQRDVHMIEQARA